MQSRAVLVAVGVNLDGRREILGIDLANRESKTSWRDFLVSLKERGLTGVQLVVSDAHEGLRRAIEETFPQALWQRCYVHYADLMIMPTRAPLPQVAAINRLPMSA